MNVPLEESRSRTKTKSFSTRISQCISETSANGNEWSLLELRPKRFTPGLSSMTRDGCSAVALRINLAMSGRIPLLQRLPRPQYYSLAPLLSIKKLFAIFGRVNKPFNDVDQLPL